MKRCCYKAVRVATLVSMLVFVLFLRFHSITSVLSADILKEKFVKLQNQTKLENSPDKENLQPSYRTFKLQEISDERFTSHGTSMESVHSNKVVLNNTPNIPVTDSLRRVFISVKTSQKYHKTRLNVLQETWFQVAPEQTYVFTDSDASDVADVIPSLHVINTHCGSSHRPVDLCCKTGVELETFLQATHRWFCHFDDDNYVNVPRLVEFLSQRDHTKDHYLGRTSTSHKMNISRDQTSVNGFWFATGGAGYCLSRPLVLRLNPHIRGKKLVRHCINLGYPDDVALGYLIENLLGTNLTKVAEFHSHIEHMISLNKDSLREQLSFSYARDPNRTSYARYPYRTNVLDVFADPWPDDFTRFKMLHCYLYPNTTYCKERPTVKLK